MKITIPRKLDRLDVILIGLLVLYGLYAARFIYNTSFVIGGVRYFSLFDDMMISMRYAKNLAHGYGPVWNAGGERVEGYTNPLWVVYMAFFHKLPISTPKICLAVQISGALFLMINLVVIRAIAFTLSQKSIFATTIALIFTAFYLPLNNWALQGTEVSILTLLVSLATWAAIRALQNERFSMIPYLCLGFATLIRMDMVVPYLSMLGFMVLADSKYRGRHLLVGILTLVAFVTPQILFRHWYYGEWLPNTYYLKMRGYPVAKRLDNGWRVTYSLVMQLNILAFGVLLFRRSKALMLLAVLFVGQLAYSLYVGGDAWEFYGGTNRYIAIAVPCFFVLLACTVQELRVHLLSTNSALYINAGIIIFTLYTFVSYNAIYGPDALKEWSLQRPPLHVDINQKMVKQALLLRQITSDDAVIGVVFAGTVPYFSDRPSVDLLGKNDRIIARGPMDQTFSPTFYPGHLKWNYRRSIHDLQPDIVIEFWRDPQTALYYLHENDSYEEVWLVSQNVWMRRGSSRILWERFR